MGKVINVDLLWIFCLFGISCVHHHFYFAFKFMRFDAHPMLGYINAYLMYIQ